MNKLAALRGHSVTLKRSLERIAALILRVAGGQYRFETRRVRAVSPTLRKKRQGWGTRHLVAGIEKGEICVCPAIWWQGYRKKGEICFFLQLVRDRAKEAFGKV
jgi:hypothetical protein